MTALDLELDAQPEGYSIDEVVVRDYRGSVVNAAVGQTVRGAIFALAPWILAMIAVMPMMGMPPFGGAAAPAIGSLIGHLVYGAVLGSIYGKPDETPHAHPIPG